jgi:hypothetical protein
MTTISQTSVLAAGSEGGGAALDQVIGLSGVALLLAAALLWVGYLHRNRKITWLTRMAQIPARKFGRPVWEALSVAWFTAAIICALFGFIWDVSLHIGNGRDEGPLANPAHYFIIIGLFLVFVAGLLAMVLPFDKPGSSAIRITRHWYAPVGGVLLAGCGLYAMTGFPLDDVWHRIFGQDVMLWGPTHLMMIGGAGFSLIGVVLLEFEGRRSLGKDAPPDGIMIRLLQYLSFGGLVIGLSVFQIEYDFGVSQFRLVFQPMLIAAAASVALVAARLALGRGGALGAAILAIVLRGSVSLLVGPVLGAPINWYPLYLGPAIVVELLALTALVKRPVLFGALAGAGIGTVGLWIESWWIAAVYPNPWPTSMWPEALAMAVPVAILGGACGGLLGMVLTGQRLPRPAVGIGIVVATVLALGGAVANGLHSTVPEKATATITLTDVAGTTDQRMVTADVQITPTDLISDNPEWVSIFSWQGGLSNERGFVVDRLNRVGPGHYQSTRPVPVWGSWKTLLRVQDGRTMTAVPIYMAADPGIGAPGLAAEPSSTRAFVPEITILQRERTFDAPNWLWTTAGIVVLALTLIMIGGITWGAGRINRTETAPTVYKVERKSSVRT